MTAFNLFQRATCEIAAGNKTEAAKLLARAIKAIDRNGVDADMRDDLAGLMAMVTA